MKRLGYSQTTDEPVDVNLSPLIDMMFLLLIFFIVTASFVDEVGVDIQRPKASAVRTLEKKSIQIGITKQGRIIYGGEEIDLSALRSMIAHMIRGEDRPVVVIADSMSYSGLLIDVIDECKAAGAQEVSVATETE
jgi:biopolymer transport protein ExbD